MDYNIGYIDYWIKKEFVFVKTVSATTSSVVISNLLNNSQYNFKTKVYQGCYDSEHIITESDLIISLFHLFQLI